MYIVGVVGVACYSGYLNRKRLVEISVFPLKPISHSFTFPPQGPAASQDEQPSPKNDHPWMVWDIYCILRTAPCF